MNAQAETSERQFWVVSKTGVDLGGAPKATPNGSRAGLSVLTRILMQLVLLLLVPRGENVESRSFGTIIMSLSIYSIVEG